MVTLLLDSTQLEVVLSGVERALSRRSESVRVDRSHILRVQLTDDAWTWLRGVPSPGTLVRGTIAMGTWRSASGCDFVVVRRRHPAAVIDLAPDAEFERLVLTTRHGIALVQALRLDGDDAPTEVSEIAAGGTAGSPAAP
ncbi:hypothetical protein ITJ43_09105 [Microbacterium sp. VKM Ac-2870]|uniref:hypothetical protein n=1 Tax=Microbacterium sp. VKM Ac-2870 TaxID=2783825 RepID=UPI00188AC4B0|nr:hypothetical protein [Microbacterium sp. VKM Ac-2870]MBF4562298.1 hypothetical protein [Microbacterium sp. VKM Ac-2870]